MPAAGSKNHFPLIRLALLWWMALAAFAARRSTRRLARTTTWLLTLPVMFLPSELVLKTQGVPYVDKNRMAFLAVLVALVMMRMPQTHQEVRTDPVILQISEGIKYVWQTPVIRTAMALVAISSLVAVSSLAVVFALASGLAVAWTDLDFVFAALIDVESFNGACAAWSGVAAVAAVEEGAAGDGASATAGLGAATGAAGALATAAVGAATPGFAAGAGA